MSTMYESLIHDPSFQRTRGREGLAEHRRRALAERARNVRARRRVVPSLRPKAA
jgi:hypothetical protein